MKSYLFYKQTFECFSGTFPFFVVEQFALLPFARNGPFLGHWS